MQIRMNKPKNINELYSPPCSPIIHKKYPIEFWEDIEIKIIALCNLERLHIGLPSLQSNKHLKQIARYKSNEMLQYDYFNHTSPVSGYKPWNLARASGYSFTSIGENIWMKKITFYHPKWTSVFNATVTASSIMNDWMNSPGHKSNILNINFNKIGVGLAYSPKLRAYAVQLFSD